MPDLIRLGTYNVNNLFDRFDDPYNYSDDPWRRAFASRPKSLDELFSLGARLRASAVEILALQEIESQGALREFVRGHVGPGPGYKADSTVSLESNDPRGIDLGVVSRLRLGRVTSHRFRRLGGKKVFSRDCLQVEVLLADDPAEVLLTMFVCHLKSKYSEHATGTPEYDADQEASREKRRNQVEATVEIIQSCLDVEHDRFAVLGDMNDTPDSNALAGFLAPDNPLHLVNALATIAQDDESPESTTHRPRDTHKWAKDEESGHLETTYSQLDYILVSQALAEIFTGVARVEHAKHTTGSDHYLCWVELDRDLL